MPLQVSVRRVSRRVLGKPCAPFRAVFAAFATRCFPLLYFLFATVAPCAIAQQDPAIQLRQEMQQRQRQEEVQAAPALPKPAVQPALAARPEDVAEPMPVLRSPAINIKANDLLGDSQIESLIAPYQRLDIGQQRISLLLRQLNAQLVTQGLVTSRATVVGVDPGANVLNIELLPGRIDAYTAGNQPLETGVQNAFPGQPSDLLVLQDIEQGVQQIQRLRRYQAEVRILPGQSSTTSLVDLLLTETKFSWLQLALDNQGAKATGRERTRASLSLDNTLGLLDNVGLTYLRSSRSEVGVAALAIPFGYNTWSASYAASRYRQDLPADLKERGGSSTATVAWNRVMHLSAAGRDMAELSLTSSDSWRKIDGIRLTPDQLAVVKAAFTGLRQGDGWRAWGELSASRGVPWLGATDDSDGLASADPHAQFTKFEAHAGLIYAPSADVGQYVGQLDAQTSRVGLYGTEQFRLGGMSTVRGFDEGAAFGDRGFVFRHEWRIKPSLLAVIDTQATPLVFVDHGSSRLVGGPTARLASAGAGMRFVARRWSADLLVARPIDHSSAMTDSRWHLHASLRIDL